jgi:hypothetical protein
MLAYGRALEKRDYTRGSRCVRMGVPHALATICKYFCAVYLLLCIISQVIMLIQDTECANGCDDHVTNVFNDADICWRIPAIVKINRFLALDVYSPREFALISRYWVSPLQYLVSGTVANALHDVSVTCTPEELSIVQPPSGNSQKDRSHL